MAQHNMAEVKINTTQNIALSFELASLSDRILATLLDLLIIGTTTFVLAMLASYTGVSFVYSSFNLVLLVPFFFYHLLMELFFHGQSPGKFWRKIKVMSKDGKEPKIGQYLIRWLIRFLEIDSCFGGIALLAFVLNKNGQRLGDLAANTIVVRIKLDYSLEDTVFRNLKPEAKIIFQEAALLKPEQVALLAKLLETWRKDLTNDAINNLIGKAKTEYAELLDIRSDLPAALFLEQLLHDYNALATGN